MGSAEPWVQPCHSEVSVCKAWMSLQPYMNEQVLRTHDIDDMIRILRRNRLLRDVWGSFFVHPFYLGTRANYGVGRFPGDTQEFERLIDAARSFGYEFIDLAEFAKKNRNQFDRIMFNPPLVPVPENMEYPFFSLEEGRFLNSIPKINFISGKNLRYLKSLLGINFEGLHELKFNGNERQTILDILLKYFELHLSGFNKPKSLAILKTVFE